MQRLEGPRRMQRHQSMQSSCGGEDGGSWRDEVTLRKLKSAGLGGVIIELSWYKPMGIYVSAINVSFAVKKSPKTHGMRRENGEKTV